MVGWLVGWLAGGVLASGAVCWLLRRAGYSAGQVALTLVVLVAAIMLGSKLLYLAEAYPRLVRGDESLRMALLPGRMRIPGGIFLAILVGPPLARMLGTSYLIFADTVAPAGGILLFGVRIGCFLTGCCFGHVWELGVVYDAATPVYIWQIQNEVIAYGAPRSLPTVPLQLYFGAAGLLMFIGLAIYQKFKRFDGEVLIGFAVSFFWSTWVLEHYRASPHSLTMNLVLMAAAASTLVLAIGRRWMNPQPPLVN